MKKLFLSLAVLSCVALVSCDGNKKAAADTDTIAQEDITVINEVATDSNDSAVAVEANATEVAAPADSAK